MKNRSNRTELKSLVNCKTLILGDVNSGKTRYTADLIAACCAAGLGTDLTVMDLAPEALNGIGGRLPAPDSPDVLVLTCTIIAPRLTGKNADHVLRLARQNARSIDPLIDQALRAGRTMLAVNDVTLYLHAGDPERLRTLIKAHPTAIVNAYSGRGLPPGPLTEIESRRLQALTADFDRIIRLSKSF